MSSSKTGLAGCALLMAAVNAGCTGNIQGDRAGGGAQAANAASFGSASSTTTGTGSGSGAASGAASASGGTANGAPGSGIAAAAAPLVRLTSVQYNNTLHALFAPISVPDQSPPPDLAVDGFDNNAATQTPSAALISAYQSSAVAVATAAMQDPAALLGCTPKTAADETACAQSFLGTFGKKAYRRALTTAELDKLLAFYQSQRSSAPFATAMTLVIEAILQSPNFLYRVEIGTTIASRPSAVQLTSSEVASRVSYLLLGSMPDDELFAAADADKLLTAAGVEEQARRLLADPRAHDAVARFHSGWLEFDKMQNLAKDTQAFPSWSPATALALQQSAAKYVDNIFFGDGTLTALLTDAHAYVNDALAPIYGVRSPGANLTLVPVDPTQRSGILTQAGLLAGFAHQTEDSPVFRGVFVLSRLMCSAPPPPPAGVNTSLPASSSGAPMTTRQAFATQHEQGACAGCHHTIDGIGFGFEQFDAIGQFRTTDNGLPVDASGWFTAGGAGDLTGTFNGPVELGQKLAASQGVQACMATQWLRHALGVDTTGIDQTQLQPIVAAFVASGLNMRELLVALTTSDAFLTRVVAP